MQHTCGGFSYCLWYTLKWLCCKISKCITRSLTNSHNHNGIISPHYLPERPTYSKNKGKCTASLKCAEDVTETKYTHEWYNKRPQTSSSFNNHWTMCSFWIYSIYLNARWLYCKMTPQIKHTCQGKMYLSKPKTPPKNKMSGKKNILLLITYT